MPLTSKPERTVSCRAFLTKHPDEFCKDSTCQELIGKRPRSAAEIDLFFNQFWNPVPKSHFLANRRQELSQMTRWTHKQAASNSRLRAEDANDLKYDDDFKYDPYWLENWASVIDS